MPEISFGHPSHLDQFGTHVAVWDQLLIYSIVNIFIICKKKTLFHIVNFRFREMLRYWFNATVDIIVIIYAYLFSC